MDWDAIGEHLPALIVLVPVLGGAVSALIGRRGLGWWIAMASSLLVLLLAVRLFAAAVLEGAQPVVYLIGEQSPLGITFVADPLSASVLLVLALVGAAVTLYARNSIASEVPRAKLRFFYALWMLCHAGLLGVVITGDLFNLFMMLELSAICAYALVAMGRGRSRRALTAAMHYLLLGSVGAGLTLFGIGCLYMVTGTLNMAEMAERLQQIYLTWQTDEPLYRRTVVTAFAVLLVGVGIKIALVPLHAWLPNAYTFAPSAVTVLLAAVVAKAGAYVGIRLIYGVFGVEFSLQGGLPTDALLMAAAAAAILYGGFKAVRQDNLKRLLAWAGLAQVGFVVLGLAVASRYGLAASVIHLFNHALIIGGTFMAAGVLVYRLGSSDIGDLRGLGRRLPVTMACLTVGGMGLIGLPLTAGFISRWYLVVATLEAGRYELTAVIAAGSVLALACVWRVVEAAYFGERPDEPKIKEAPLTMLLPMLLLIGASVYFGVNAATSGAVAEMAADFLLGQGP
jgi:multicomponent Na+:H+ antiporter subunit D